MPPEESDAALLVLYDVALRRGLHERRPGWTTERVGQVVRTTSPPGLAFGCCVQWSDLTGDTADAAIAAQVDHFGALGRPFEWKAYGHDRPADLPQRLAAAGLVAQQEEALVVGSVEDVLAATAGVGPPEAVAVRELGPDEPLASIATLQEVVWGGRWTWLTDELAAERAADPASLAIFVAEADGELVSAGWVRCHAGTPFASLWGGSTLPQWRRRGIYRALVARRAVLARERGARYLQVDASPDSRPILERLGLRRLTTTTPWVGQPPGGQA